MEDLILTEMTEEEVLEMYGDLQEGIESEYSKEGEENE